MEFSQPQNPDLSPGTFRILKKSPKPKKHTLKDTQKTLKDAQRHEKMPKDTKTQPKDTKRKPVPEATLFAAMWWPRALRAANLKARPRSESSGSWLALGFRGFRVLGLRV